MGRIDYSRNETISNHKWKKVAAFAAAFIFAAICFAAGINGAFYRVLYYVSDKFFTAMLPSVYYGEENSLQADIQEELLPVMAGLSEDEEDDSYYDFQLADSDGNKSGTIDAVQGSEDSSGTAKDEGSAEATEQPQNTDTAYQSGTETKDGSEADGQEAGSAVWAQSFSAIPVSYNGTVYSREQICDYDFLVSNIFAIDKSASVTAEEMDGANLLDQDMSIDLSGDDYKVLIYHTHGSEAFIDSREGVIEDTIIGVGDTLTELLEQYGIKVYHDRTVYDMVDGKLDRSYAYNQASDGIDQILAEHPSIEVVIDLHRDGVQDNVHLVTDIDGRPTAKIMFLNGISRSKKNGDLEHLYNPNKIGNLAFSLQMYLEGKKISNDYVRKIYVKMYRFNLEKRPRSTLIEAGAQTNTVEEEKNAMIPLAAILYSVLSGEQ